MAVGVRPSVLNVHRLLRPVRPVLATGALIALWSGLSATQASAMDQMERDLAARLPEIHWPSGFEPKNADLFAHNAIEIEAPCAVAWSRLISAEEWPKWYPNSSDVRVQSSGRGVLNHGATFQWRTFGLDIASRVHEFEPERRLGWFGDAPGLNAYHTWLLTEGGGKCRVVNEEVVKGPAAVKLRQSDPDAMHKGHDRWNEVLKQASEKG